MDGLFLACTAAILSVGETTASGTVIFLAAPAECVS
jgi:hypothetical protein